MTPILRSLMLMLFGILLGGLQLQAQIATIATDQADYPPGSTVLITGSGFTGGEQVQLQIIHTDGFGDNTQAHHQPFFATVNPDGTVVSSWYIPTDQDEFGATLLLTADGLLSGLHAETTFTDGVSITGPTSGCVGSSVTFNSSVTSPQNLFPSYQWRLNGNNIAGATGASYTISSVVAGSTGSYTVRAVNLFGQAATSNAISFTALAAPTSPNAGPDQTVCTSTATLAGNTITAGSGAWTRISGAGTVTTPSSPTSGITGLGLGANTFRWTSTLGTCTQFQDVVITRNGAPTTANAGGDRSVCRTGTITLAANTPTQGTGVWSVTGPSNSNAQFSSTTSPTATFSPAGGTGTYTLTWTISNNCGSSSDVATVTALPTPSAANAGADRTVCITGAPFQLAGNSPAVGTGTWSVVSGPGLSAAQFSSINSPTSTFNPLGGAGVYTLRWTISSPSCPSVSDDMVITVNSAPVGLVANVSNSTICSGAQTTLSGSSTGTVATLINEDFNDPQNTFTSTGTVNGTGSIFTQRASGYGLGLNTITNNDGSSFMIASATGGFLSTSSTNSSLTTSPVISTVGLSTLSLTFRHSYQEGTESGVSVQVSTNPGNTVWVNVPTPGVPTYTTSQGSESNFVTATFNLSQYVNQPNFRFRFQFNSTTTILFANSWWAIDDVRLTGIQIPTYSWSGTPAVTSGLSAAAQTASASNSSVVVSPTATTSYTLTATNPFTNCGATSAPVTVTVNNAPTFTTCPQGDILVSTDPGVCNTYFEYTIAATSIPAPTYSYQFSGATFGSGTGTGSGSTFNGGITNVVVTATNTCGSTTCNFTITVYDFEAPVLGDAAAVFANTDPGQCSAIVTMNPPVATDNCDVVVPDGTRTDGFGITDPFPIGQTIVTWNVTDGNGNGATPVQQTITVTDNEIPVITASPDISVNNDAGECSAAVNLANATATDNCPIGAVTGIRSDNAVLSAPFNVGTTTITWTVADASGNNAAPVTQTVTVTDNERPVITSGASISANNTPGLCSANVSVTAATATDNCGVGSPIGSRDDSEPLNATYPVGTTTITWNVTDVNGNAALPVTQTVIVADNELPVITAGANITQSNDDGACGANVNVIPATATDNCSVAPPTGTRNDGFALNAQYPVGTTTITWTATDIHGNNAVSVQQTVTVNDNELPVATAAADVTSTADAGECGALLTIVSATATDNCVVATITGTRSDNLSLTAAFPVGTTTITWTATDIHGNTSAADLQTITVTDNEVPVITEGADITVNNDPGVCGAIVPVANATATDNCGVGTPTAARSDLLPLNAPYPVGTTTITWTVSDVNGNAAVAATQTITVVDNERPVITAGANITRGNDLNQCGAMVTITPATAADNCSVGAPVGTRSDNQALHAQYPVGTTTITGTATDIHGNVALSVQQTVTVNDIQNPVITCPANILLSACTPTATWSLPTVTDNCPGTTLAQTAGPASGSTFANGSSTTITYAATDASGKITNCSFTVKRATTLVVTGSNSNPQLFFGYSGDQSSTIKAVASGGTGPYTISITMDRALKCNYINDAGDEKWTSAGSSTNNVCPGFPALATAAPVSTSTGTTLSVNVILMADAVITATVTDANGCTVTYTTTVSAEDVRCFAGNSGNTKIVLCHRTGAVKNPCVKICVDASAVQEHLDHGDYMGNCTPNCVAPVVATSGRPGAATIEETTKTLGDLSVKVMPNPTTDVFNLVVNSSSKEAVKITIVDVTGRIIDQKMNQPANGTIQLGNRYFPGIYFAEVMQGKTKLTLRLVKSN